MTFASRALASLVDIGGRTVVDVYGGFADEARTRSWERDTIVNVWSSTKTVTSPAVLMLADRGLVDLDDPVAGTGRSSPRRGRRASSSGT